MKTKNTEALQWFVDFANLDLQTIKPGDKAKLLVEAEEYLWPIKDLEELAGSFSLSLEALLSMPKLASLEWVWVAIRKESQKYWTAIVESQRNVRGVFLDTTVAVPPLTIGLPPSKMPVLTWNIATEYHGSAPQMLWGKDMMLWCSGKRGNEQKPQFAFKLLPVTESQKDYLLLKILRLLDGFPGHAIRRCPGCDKLFMNPTRRVKRFCSARCMAKVLTRERREADREAYNNYQKELMKKKRKEDSKWSPKKKTKAGKTKGERVSVPESISRKKGKGA